MNGFEFNMLSVVACILIVRAEKYVMSSAQTLDTISLMSKLKMSVLLARNLPGDVTSLPACSE
jgi:hypothetical protein